MDVHIIIIVVIIIIIIVVVEEHFLLPASCFLLPASYFLLPVPVPASVTSRNNNIILYCYCGRAAPPARSWQRRGRSFS